MRTIATSLELLGATRLQQVEIHLAAAEHDAPHAGLGSGIELIDQRSQSRRPSGR